jgi:hypothetical protein
MNWQDARLTCTLFGGNVRCTIGAIACLHDTDHWRPTVVARSCLGGISRGHLWGVAHSVLAEIASATTPQTSTAGVYC